MSTLQTLRNKAGLLIAVTIGLALLAFILTDLLQSGKSMFSGPETTVAIIDGKEVPIDKYTTMLTNMEENQRKSQGVTPDERTRMNFKRNAWDEIVKDALYENELKSLGLGIVSAKHQNMLGVTDEELKDMVLGENISPIVKQYFTNPDTKQYDRNAAKGFLQNMGQDEAQKSAWIELEKVLMTERLRTKYKNLITKALYVTNKEAEQKAEEKNKTYDIKFVSVMNNTVADSTISVSESELKSYYSDHKKDYKQEEAVDIEYVTFKILPSDKDYEATKKWIQENKDDFQLTENNEQFVRSNSDIPFDSKYYGPGELAVNLDALAFSDSAKVGDVTDIYFENEHFKVSKISDIKQLPDSVHARHILLKSQNAVAIADSLIGLLNNGADFAKLAMENSEGPTATKGGDLGWFKEGQMVKPFNDTCFFKTPGKYYKVFSQFGVHVLEILAQSQKSEKVQIATLSSKVVPSSVTRNTIYAKAGKFANQNTNRDEFLASISPEVTGDKKIASGIKKSDYTIVGLENSRQIIKWAFETEENEVSEVFECGENFVVAALADKVEEGIADLEDVEDQIKIELYKEKKGEQIKSKFSSVAPYNSLEELAKKLDTQVNDATSISFASGSIPNIGAEGTVLGTIAVLEPGKISEPIVGDMGVYVVSVTNVNETNSANPVIEKEQMMRSLASRFQYNIEKALKENAEIVDNRIIFE